MKLLSGVIGQNCHFGGGCQVVSQLDQVASTFERKEVKNRVAIRIILRIDSSH